MSQYQKEEFLEQDDDEVENAGRVKGLVAADLTQLIAFCGFFSMFFYATLYMQEVLHYSPLRAGVAYLPITAGFALAGGLSSQLVTRIGTRPVVVAGCLVAAAGIAWVSRVPLHGSYAGALLPGFLVMSLGAATFTTSLHPSSTAASITAQASSTCVGENLIPSPTSGRHTGIPPHTRRTRSGTSRSV